MRTPHHIPVLDPLRGIAAFAVCVYHLSQGNAGFLESDDPVSIIGSFGWLGVDAFFVISGFIIPLSLHLRSYTIRESAPFFIRRLKRLEPPYFCCIALVILLHHLSMQVPGFRGGPLDLSWPKLAAHVAYLNAILDYGWLNPVFWTLAIEFQYYLFVAIVFPLLAHTNTYISYASTLLIAVLGFAGLGNSALLPHWLPLFAMGMVAYQFYVGRLPVYLLLLSLTLIASLSNSIVGLQPTIAGLLTASVIVLARDKQLPRLFIPLSFLGTISYSLYLLHVPVGVRVINLADRLPESITYRYPALVIAFTVSVIAAYVFWQVVERPSQRWSRVSAQPISHSSDEQAHAAESTIEPVPDRSLSSPAR